MTAPQTNRITHRSVLAIAVPIMLSNVTEPMIGAVNAAVIGQLPQAYYIGAITVGALIFNFIFWGFSFLRIGTGGLAGAARAQGYVLILAKVIGVWKDENDPDLSRTMVALDRALERAESWSRRTDRAAAAACALARRIEKRRSTRRKADRPAEAATT